MSIDENAVAHIMSILTDLYSNPELAVIREYSTNAYDAHVEAGITRPIEVTLPSALAPQFKVRDFGEGLDADDIREMYSKYGASSKRNSNDVVGMLGLGCKSALTYTDQFTLTGIKNGVCTQVAVSRDEDGSGSMTIIDEYQTDEESGVEVVVPALRNNSFASQAADFFRFWEEGTVLVNGSEPKRIDGLRIADDILLTQEVDGSMIVMGNVAYPVSNDNYASDRYPFVAWVPIGSVNFTPSREQLQMTRKTKDKIEEVKERVKNERNSAIRKMVDDAPTKQEALQIALSAPGMGYSGDPLKYKGQEFPRNITTEKDAYAFVIVNNQKWYGSKGWGKNTELNASVWSRHMWLVGHKAESFSPTKRKKLTQWIQKNPTTKDFILVEKLPKEIRPWIPKENVRKWDEVAAEKVIVERSPGVYGEKPTGSYKAYVAGAFNKHLLAEDIDASKPLFYLNTTIYADNSLDRTIVNHYHKDVTIVLTPQNRIAKFKRDFPTAKDFREVLSETITNWTNKLTDDDKLALKYKNDYYSRGWRSLDHSRIDDPKFAAMLKLINSDRIKRLQKEIEIFGSRAQTRVQTTAEFDPTEDYPLLTGIGYHGTMGKAVDHVYLYLNAAYAARKEQA
jgi:hypothetical protein